jgi:hypothetical protein
MVHVQNTFCHKVRPNYFLSPCQFQLQTFFVEHILKLWSFGHNPNADVAWVCRTDIRMRPHVLLPLQHQLLLV